MTATAEEISLGASGGDIENWRRLAEDRLEKLTDLQNEFAEFQATSHEFEAELERELDAKDRALKEANKNSSRVGEERDVLRNRVVTLQTELARLEAENDQLRTTEVQSRDLIRQLEQKNDDLERSLRVTASSLEDLEQRFSQSLEEKALLSTELSEKEALQVAVQRLKDEVRDLRQELSVRVQHEQQLQQQYQRRRNTDAAASPISFTPNGNVPSSPSADFSATAVSSGHDHATTSVSQQASIVAPPPRRTLGVSTRQAALDCVQQLINCVTMMESKVDQLKRRMDREPSTSNGTAANNSLPASTPPAKPAPPHSLITSNGINGINSPNSRHMPPQVPVQSSLTPKRF